MFVVGKIVEFNWCVFWQEMKNLREMYKHKLKLQQQKTSKPEQALAVQEKRQKQDKYANLQLEKDAAMRQSQNQADASDPENLASSSFSQTPKTPSSSSIQSSPGDVSQEPAMQDEMAMENTEIMALRSQIQALQAQLEEKEQQLLKTQSEMES